MDHIPDHFKQAIVKPISAFWGKPRFASLLWCLIRQTQLLEDEIKRVGDRYTVEGADSARLDVLGRIVGQPRFGFGDEAYRAVIRGRIRAARSHGRTDDIIEVLRLVTGTTDTIRVQHVGGATARVAMPASVQPDQMTAVAYLLPKARAAGVQLHFRNPPPSGGLTAASSISGGGGDLASSVSGGGDPSFSARIL